MVDYSTDFNSIEECIKNIILLLMYVFFIQKMILITVIYYSMNPLRVQMNLIKHIKITLLTI